MLGPAATTDHFALTIARLNLFVAGYVVGLEIAMRNAAPYEPTAASAKATRRSIGAQGLAHFLTSHPKPTANERTRATAARLGFINGRFVG